MTAILQKKTDRIELDVSDCVLSRNALTINSKAGFLQAGAALANIDSCSQWWWGDYLVYAERHNLRSILESAQADLHRSTLYSYVETARLYAPADRHPELSFGHHAAVMYILGPTGSSVTAKKWLKKAAENNWKVGDLREQMRLDQRKSESDPGPMRGVIRITDFVKVSRWSETVTVSKLPDKEAEEIRASTGPLFQFLCELHRKPFSSP